jgi:hypothetical protein
MAMNNHTGKLNAGVTNSKLILFISLTHIDWLYSIGSSEELERSSQYSDIVTAWMTRLFYSPKHPYQPHGSPGLFHYRQGGQGMNKTRVGVTKPWGYSSTQPYGFNDMQREQFTFYRIFFGIWLLFRRSRNPLLSQKNVLTVFTRACYWITSWVSA